jgi:hypothetical protein
MIQANELRIGNWFYVPAGGHKQISDFEIMNFAATNPSAAQIPLTPEILEKCGFEAPDYRFPNHSFYSLQNWLEVSGEVRQSIWLLYANDDEYRTGTEFQYLHQLQNLYFALTGNELTVNL